MNVEFLGEVGPLRSPSFVIDTDGVFIAHSESSTSNAITVHYIDKLQAQPLILNTALQRKPATAICFAHGTPGSSDPDPYRTADDPRETLLCVACPDAVVIWRLSQAYASAADGTLPPEPILLLAGPGQVDALAVSEESQQLALCAGAVVYIFEISSLKNTFKLEGHQAAVLAACFCEPHVSQLLVTAGEDRTFKVWDLEEGCMVYESSILTAYPLTSIAVDPSFLRVAIGASDGVVRFFDLSGLPACRGLKTLDVARQVQKIAEKVGIVVASASAQGKGDGPKVITANSVKRLGGELEGKLQDQEEGMLESSGCVVTGCSVIRLMYSPLVSTLDQEDDLGLLGESPKLMVGMPRSLVILDTQTYEVVESHFLNGGTTESAGIADYFRRQAKSGQAGVNKALLKSASSTDPMEQCGFIPECNIAGAFSFALEPKREKTILCCVSAAFEPLACVFSLHPKASEAGLLRENQHLNGINITLDEPSMSADVCSNEDHLEDVLSVFLTRPLPANSPLRVTPNLTSSGNGDLGPTPSKGESSSLSGAHNRHGSRRNSASPSSSAAAVGSAPRPSNALPRSNSNGRFNGSPSHGGSKTQSTASKSPAGPTASVKKLAPKMSQQVTFNRKIKSSGYGFVQPQVRMGCAPPAPIKVTKTAATSSIGRHLLHQRSYPIMCEPLIHPQPKNSLPGNAPVHGSAILRIAYSSDASRLLTASADRTARVMKLPLSKFQGEGTDLIGHNAAVLSSCWSHDGTMVLTASADRTARLWNAAWAQPLLQFTHMQQQVTTVSTALPPVSPSIHSKVATASSDTPNTPFVHEVQAARFFYMDQFVFLATGSKLLLYRYRLTEGMEDDLERLRNNNKYRLASTYCSASQSITEFSCINSFLSPLALLTGSNRSIEVIDVTTMQRRETFEDAHARPAHAIVQSACASMFVSHAKEAYELFATASQDNTAKLWDVRSRRCVRTFTGHKNSQVATNIAFSPCFRYLASGSEDKCIYMYDLRMGTVFQRIRGTHGDAVMDVAFNPLHPQLAAACLDGRVHFYSDAQ